VCAPSSGGEHTIQNRCSHPLSAEQNVVIEETSELAIFRHGFCIRKRWILAESALLLRMIKQQGYMNMSVSKARRKAKISKALFEEET